MYRRTDRQAGRVCRILHIVEQQACNRRCTKSTSIYRRCTLGRAWQRKWGSGACVPVGAFTWKFRLNLLPQTHHSKIICHSSKTFEMTSLLSAQIFAPLSLGDVWGRVLDNSLYEKQERRRLKREGTSRELVKMRHQCLIETRDGKEWRCWMNLQKMQRGTKTVKGPSQTLAIEHFSQQKTMNLWFLWSTNCWCHPASEMGQHHGVMMACC